MRQSGKGSNDFGLLPLLFCQDAFSYLGAGGMIPDDFVPSANPGGGGGGGGDGTMREMPLSVSSFLPFNLLLLLSSMVLLLDFLSLDLPRRSCCSNSRRTSSYKVQQSSD